VLGIRRLDLYLQHDRPLQPPELRDFKALLLRRAGREPLQYVVGQTSFRELELKSDPRALIPRPETEVLVEQVLSWVRGQPSPSGGSDAKDRSFRAVDVGTGTGAIALSLLTEGPFGTVVAIDRSADALALAAENGTALGLSKGLELRQGNGLEPLASHERFEVIVSNPPYVSDGDQEALAPEIRDWEPMEALLAGPEGLDLLRPIIAGAPDHLVPGGLLALEVGSDQGRRLAREMEASERLQDVRLAPDLAGRDRVVLAIRK
jgi:release factor glutamine methyltransferase